MFSNNYWVYNSSRRCLILEVTGDRLLYHTPPKDWLTSSTHTYSVCHMISLDLK